MFDSGVGGLTVFTEVQRLLPKESVIYLADTARVPYGGRPPSDIIKINKEIMGFFVSLGVKLVIIACGTSSAIAYPLLKDKYKIPLIGLIEGGAKVAVSATKNKKIGIIATAGTINSLAYQNAIKALNKDIETIGVACPLLVPLIEGGFAGSDETSKVLKEYLKPLIKAKVDTLILGCTHYPHLISKIREIMGPGVELVNPAEEAVMTARDILVRTKMAVIPKEPPKHRFLSTGPAGAFRDLGSRLLGRPIPNVEEIALVKGRGTR